MLLCEKKKCLVYPRGPAIRPDFCRHVFCEAIFLFLAGMSFLRYAETVRFCSTSFLLPVSSLATFFFSLLLFLSLCLFVASGVGVLRSFSPASLFRALVGGPSFSPTDTEDHTSAKSVLCGSCGARVSATLQVFTPE